MIRRFIFLSGAVVLALVALVSVQSVLAHSRPIRFDPPPGAVLETAPSRVTGWFTQPLRRDANWTFLHVTDSEGNRVDSGADVTLSTDRKQMTANLNPGLAPGRYLVAWRGWDDNDGAIFGDCYAFFVGEAAAEAAVSDNTRLDGGNACQRIDVSARDGTPVAGGTPQATPGTGGESGDGDGMTSSEATESEADSGLPAWTLVLGVVAGLVIGGIGGRALSGRS